MRTSLIVLVAVQALTACKKGESTSSGTGTGAGPAPAPISPKEADALWAFAPEKMTIGFVATPRALNMLEGAVVDVQSFITQTPELAMIAQMLQAKMAEAIGGPFTSLAELGVDKKKGFAFFLTDAGPIVVAPIGDRAKLYKVVGKDDKGPDTLGKLTCKTLNGAFVCAPTKEVLATLTGTGTLPKSVADIGARGDVELTATEPVAAGGVLQLERGAFVVRGAATAPAKAAQQLAAAAKPRIVEGETAAFGIANLAGFLGMMPEDDMNPQLAAIVKSIAGAMTATIAGGDTVPDVRLPLSDPAPLAGLLAQCKELVPPLLLAAKQTDGACSITVAQYAMDFDVWIEGKELRLGRKSGAKPANKVALTPLGKEIASGSWAFAFWGRGTLFGTTALPGMTPGAMPPEAAMVLRGVTLLQEMGVAVNAEGPIVRFVVGARSIWSNPPDAVAKLIAVKPEDLMAGKSDVAAAIVKASPGSPFAQDVEAGQGGLMIQTAAIGILAAVAIPAFMDYMKKSKKSEAQLQLNRLGKSAKVYFITNSKLPVGDAPVTPAKSCCAMPGMKCTTTAADWATPAWQALDFQIDEPSLYRYGYKSDGKVLEATATADLDCDGTEITYKLRMTVDGTDVKVETQAPPPSSD